jgi:hypothetical protein
LIGLRFSAFLNSFNTTLMLEPSPFSHVHSKSTAASSSATSNALGLRSKSSFKHCMTWGEKRLLSEVETVCPEPTSVEIDSINCFCCRFLLLSIALKLLIITLSSCSVLQEDSQTPLSQTLSSPLCI